jgi:undecaprenyl diphosphate synthase
MARPSPDSLAPTADGGLNDKAVGSGPRHVAIIMDGNGRWATMRGRPRLFGHHAGAKRVREIVEACPDLGVKYLTIFAFSTENWKRTQVEVAGLMSLFRRYITREARHLRDEGVRVRFIGDRVRLDSKLVSLMDEL